MDFESYLSHVLDDYPQSKVKDAMLYSLMAGGKRIRPKLLFAYIEDMGMETEDVYPIAAAIEMIHTYSLIHDDLPAMDDDDLRRGCLTCHKKFDEATAILAGDGLLTHAFSTVLRGKYSAEVKLKLVQSLCEFAGVGGMIYGQDMDMNADATLDFESLKKLQNHKTGKLLQLPLVCGCLISDREKDLAAWKKIGESLGLAFQIQDDLLDVQSTVEQLGKSQSDLKNEKATMVSCLGIDSAKQMVSDLFIETSQVLEGIAGDHQKMRELIHLIAKRKN